MKIVSMLTLALGLVSGVFAADTDSKSKAATKDKPYPLDTCIVSDEKLGEMGDPFVTSYKGQQIKMCCKSCNKDFTKNPEKYLKKLAAAPAPKK